MSITISEVRGIMPNTELIDDQIKPFLISAERFLDNAIVGHRVSTNLYDELLRWLTAHFITATTDRVTQKEKAGDAEVTYFGEYGMGLESTPYGQMALSLDTSGALANANTGQNASFYAVPTPKYEGRRIRI